MTIEPCPECGKMPRIHYSDRKYATVIQCKPFLRKAHLVATDTGSFGIASIENAIRKWNHKADLMEDEWLNDY